jgi:hypothetical protein
VCRADQCIGPSPETRGYPIPAGNCGPVSSDVYVLDMFIFFTNLCFIYIHCIREIFFIIPLKFYVTK